jgi:hypothetical protein
MSARSALPDRHPQLSTPQAPSDAAVYSIKEAMPRRIFELVYFNGRGCRSFRLSCAPSLSRPAASRLASQKVAHPVRNRYQRGLCPARSPAETPPRHRGAVPAIKRRLSNRRIGSSPTSKSKAPLIGGVAITISGRGSIPVRVRRPIRIRVTVGVGVTVVGSRGYRGPE